MKRIKKVAVAFMIAFAVMLSFQVVAEDMTTTSVKAAVRARNKGTKYIIKGNKIRIYTIGARGKVRYYSSNKKVATVNSSGLVVTKGCGTTRISAKASNLNDYWTLKVENPKISATKKTVNVGAKYNLKVSGTKQKVTWKSLDTSIASVNSKGQVTVKKDGYAIIKASLSQTGKTFYCELRANYNGYLKVGQKRTTQGAMVYVKNTSKVPISFMTRSVFKNASKKVLDTKDGVCSCIGPGRTVHYNVSSSSVKGNYKYLSTSVTYSRKSTYANIANSCKVVSCKNNSYGGVDLTIANNSKYKASYVGVSVIYYNGNTMVGIVPSVKSSLAANSSGTISITAPYDASYSSRLTWTKAVPYIEYAYK